MPDVSGLPALDVAIGLAFLFFLLSTACSAVNEAIANVLGWRAKTLEDALHKLLGDKDMRTRREKAWDATRGALGLVPKKRQAQEQSGGDGDLTHAVLENWRIQGTVRNPESALRRRRRPSYLPAKTFSLALAETLAAGAPKDGQTGDSLWKKTDDAIFDAAQVEINKLPEAARPLLQRAATSVKDDLETFRKNVESAFNDTMERASGWYKRKVQFFIAIIALAVAVGLNVDTVHIGTRLWKDPALRSAVVAKATAAQDSATASTETSDASAKPPTPAQQAANEIDQVQELNLPLGWRDDNAPGGLGEILRTVPGWLITVAALMLGAPFWFDVLSRFSRLRGSGKQNPPRTSSDNAAASADQSEVVETDAGNA